jgi:hypothetical protein
MKRAFFLSGFTLSSLLSIVQRKIAVPYFGYLTNTELCGAKSSHCQPSTSRISQFEFVIEDVYIALTGKRI